MAFELDTKFLRYFVAVAAHRSFTLGAAYLRITQSAATKQILAVERAYGVTLFLRKGHQLSLTESGEVLYRQARTILEQVDSTEALLKQASVKPMGRLAIGAPTATGELMLPAVIAEYRLKFPDVHIHVVTGYTGDLIEMLAAGRLDLALIFGQALHTALDVRTLSRVELGLLAPARGHDATGGATRITFAEAARLPLILPSRAHSMRLMLEQTCRDLEIEPNVVVDSDSLPISKALVKSGVGFMFLSAAGALQELKVGELRYIAVDPAIEWSLSLATRRAKSVNLATRLMVDEIIERTGCLGISAVHAGM